MSTTRKVPQEVIDLVREKKVLLAACAFTVNECARDTFNFTVPIFVQTYSFLTSRPKQLSRALLFASPFTKEVRISETRFLPLNDHHHDSPPNPRVIAAN